MRPKDTEEIANSVDPDQTLWAVWSGSALFAQACLSENLGSLPYSFLFFFSSFWPFHRYSYDVAQFSYMGVLRLFMVLIIKNVLSNS